MIWDGTQTVHSNWGSAPTLQQPLTIALKLNIAATSIRLYSLDNQGKESGFKTYQPNAAGLFEITIDQNQSKTLWFGIEAFGPNIVSALEPATDMHLIVSPNPVQDLLRVETSEVLPAGATFLLTDAQGRIVRTLVLDGEKKIEVPVRGLAPGMYFAIVQSGGKVWRQQVVIN
jgi:hypothetical protein